MFRTKLTAAGCSWFLARNGFHTIDVAVREMDTSHILFDHLQFSFSPTGQQLDCRLEQATLTFTPARLLQGWIDKAGVSQVAIQRKATETKTPSSFPDLSGVITYLLADWQNLVPISSLKIDALHLSGDDIPPALQQSFDLTLTNNGILQVKSNTDSDGQGPGINLELKKSTRRLVLGIKVAETGEAWLALNKEERNFSTHFSFELKKMSAWLNQFGLPDASLFSQVEHGHLAGTISGDLGQLPPQSLAVKAHLDSFSTADVAAGGANLYVKLHRMRETNGYFLHPDSLIELTDVHMPGLSFQQGNFPLTGVIGKKETGINFQLDNEAAWAITQVQGRGVSAEQLQCLPDVSGTLTSGVSRVHFSPSFFCTGEKIVADPIYIPKLILQANHENRLEVRTKKVLIWSLDGSDWSLDMPALKKDDLTFGCQPFSVTIGRLGNVNGYINLDGRMATSEVFAAQGVYQTTVHDVSAQVSLDRDRFKAGGTFSPGGFGQPVTVNINHILSTGKGRLSLRTRKPLHLSKAHPVSSFVTEWLYSFDVDGGKLMLKLDAEWAREKLLTAEAFMNFDSVSGRWKELTFSGLSLRHRLRLFPTITSLDTMQLSVNELNPGIPVTDVAARLRFSKNNKGVGVDLKQLTFNLFDGAFTVEPLLYHTANETHRLNARLQHLDLALAIPYQKIDGLTVSGLVDGHLPIEVDSDGLRMEDGLIWQNGEGTIAYRLEDTTAMKKAGLPDVVIKAIEDFRYHAMKVRANYHPDGLLDLAIQLQGKSPRIDTKRPIHINLNVEQNLLYLLKSLRYSGRIGEEIEKTIEKSIDRPKKAQ